MKYTILEALKELKPEATWSISGNNYSDLEWQDSSKTKPTETEINTKISDLDAAESMRLLRKERNSLLNQTDWTQHDDVPSETKTKWQTYRQQLRDLPASASPTLDSDYNLNFSSGTWPTEPT